MDQPPERGYSGSRPDLTDGRRAFREFCNRQNCDAVDGLFADLWGFGTVKIWFAPKDHDIAAVQFWVSLVSLAEPTGCSIDQLTEFWEADRAAGRPDVELLRFDIADDPDQVLVPLVGNAAAMRIFLEISPWAAEFAKSLLPDRLVTREIADSLGLPR